MGVLSFVSFKFVIWLFSYTVYPLNVMGGGRQYRSLCFSQ